MDIVGLLEPLKPYMIGTMKGFGSGVMAAGIGYLKNKGEEFDGMKFTRTIVVGGIVGALGEGFGVSPETAEEWLAYPIAIYFVDAAVKAVYRRAVAPLVDKIRELVGKA